MDLNKEIETFEQQAQDYRKDLYSNLKPSQKLQIARHPERPNFLDYVNHICEDFVELHGDREGMDDRAIIGGLAKIGDKKVMLIGTQKGKSTKENLEYMSKLAVEESGMGAYEYKVIKNRLAAVKSPGVEDLTTEALSGDDGLTLVEYCPFGVIGAIAPTTKP